MTATDKLHVIIEADDKASGVLKKIGKQANKTFGTIGKLAQNTGKKISSGLGHSLGFLYSSFKKVAVAGAGLSGVGLKLAGDFEQTRVAFENMYGSAKQAGEVMKQLNKFAAKTPFEFPEITEAAIKLQNVAGITRKDLIPTLTALGDIASSQGKSLDQMTEAFNDAIMGEFERLKEFGIKASSAGDKVTFTFRGQKVTVDKTKEGIQQYLMELSKMDGIAGGMAKQSQTLNGLMSTLKDTGASFLRTFVGISDTGEIIKGSILDNFKKMVAGLLEWINTNQDKIKDFLAKINYYFQFGFGVIKGIIDLFFQDSQDGFGKWVNKVLNFVKGFFEILKGFWNKYGDDIITVTKFIFGLVKTIISTAMQYILPIIKSTFNVIGNIFHFFASIIKGDFSGAWDAAKGIVFSSVSLIKDTIVGAFNLINNIIKQIFGIDIKQSFIDFYNTTVNIFTNVKNAIVDKFNSVKQPVLAVIEWVKKKIEWIMNKINYVKRKIAGITKAAGNIVHSVGSKISGGYNAVKNFAGFRANGGPVQAGKTYIVGERGPEYFTPKTSGTIIPNGASSGVNININMGGVVVNNEADENRLVEKIKYALSRDLQYANLGIN